MRIKSTTRHQVHPGQPAPPGTTIILSNIDQVMPRLYTNMLYYFSPPTIESSGSSDFMSTELLKHSLAETLSMFYPLAGHYRERTNGGLDIECDNSAVELHEVLVEGNFKDEFTLDWQPTPASQLLLPQFDWRNAPASTEIALLQTQVSRFECGMVSLGVAVHHHVCDGLGVANFASAWAKFAASKGNPVSPLLDRHLLKPREPPNPSFDHIEYALQPPIPPSSLPAMTAKMFEFGPDRILALKKKSGELDSGRSFTSFEVLAGHVWKFVTKARELEAAKEIKLGFAVDGRKRLDPPLPDSYFGNVNFFGLARSTAGDLVSKPVAYAATRVHEAISRMTDEYMRSALDWIEERNNPLTVFPSFHSFLGPDTSITSWTRFPSYEVDFGWGRPKFFGIKDFAWDGLAVLLPSSSESSVNVLVGLTVRAMTKLESDPEFYRDLTDVTKH